MNADEKCFLVNTVLGAVIYLVVLSIVLPLL